MEKNESPVIHPKLKITNKWKHYFKKKRFSKAIYIATSQYLRFDEKAIILKDKSINLKLSQIYEIYSRNVKKHTFLAIILPSITFFVLSLISFWVYAISQWAPNIAFYKMNENTQIFTLFLSGLYLFLSAGCAYKWLIRKDVCIMTKTRNQSGYHHISHQKINHIMEIFHMHCKKEHIFFAPIENERIMIREFKAFDALDYYEMASNQNVCRYLSFDVIKSIDEAKKIINQAQINYENKEIFKLAIEDKSLKTVIGYIGLSRYDLTQTSCQIVYAISERFWHQGYASEAVLLFLTYLKSQGKTLILAGHVAENDHSGKVLLKTGFVRDDTRDHQMMIHGEEKKIHMYVIDERI